jgi:hypothetical protein
MPWGGLADVMDPIAISKAFGPWHDLAAKGFAVLILLQGRKEGGQHGEEVAFSHQILAEFDSMWTLSYKGSGDDERYLRTFKCQKWRLVRGMKGDTLVLREGDGGQIAREKEEDDRYGIIPFVRGRGGDGALRNEIEDYVAQRAPAGEVPNKRKIRSELDRLVRTKALRKEGDDKGGRGKETRFFVVVGPDLSGIKVNPDAAR